MGAAAHFAPDQSCILKGLDVLRGGSERDRERRRKLAYCSFALGEIAKHPPARGVAERVKDGIKLRRF